jgi:hypothetical protein
MTNSLIEFIRSQLLEINQATHHGLNALLPLSPPPPPHPTPIKQQKQQQLQGGQYELLHLLFCKIQTT